MWSNNGKWGYHWYARRTEWKPIFKNNCALVGVTLIRSYVTLAITIIRFVELNRFLFVSCTWTVVETKWMTRMNIGKGLPRKIVKSESFTIIQSIRESQEFTLSTPINLSHIKSVGWGCTELQVCSLQLRATNSNNSLWKLHFKFRFTSIYLRNISLVVHIQKSGLLTLFLGHWYNLMNSVQTYQFMQITMEWKLE